MNIKPAIKIRDFAFSIFLYSQKIVVEANVTNESDGITIVG